MTHPDYIGEGYRDAKASDFIGGLFRHDAAHYVIRTAKPGGGWNAPGTQVYGVADLVVLPDLRLSASKSAKRYQLTGRS